MIMRLALTAILLAIIASPLRAADPPSLILEAPGIIVQSGSKVVIYAFPPVGFDANRAPGVWPYPYPPYPYAHPAFPAGPVYPSFSAPAPYVPLGSPYPPPPVEVRGIELKPGGRLVIEVEPKDAEVFVDGMRLTSRTAQDYDLGLLAGRHRVDVRRSGMGMWSQDVEVPPGGGLLIKVELIDQKSGPSEPKERSGSEDRGR